MIDSDFNHLRAMQRRVKNTEKSLRNHLKSIVQNSESVQILSACCPFIGKFANLRNGVWYCPNGTPRCYFKSADGHHGHWKFSLGRTNLHVVQRACQDGGCIIVDTTRRGKSFPDSFYATVPIWCALLNAILGPKDEEAHLSSIKNQKIHLDAPPWMPASTKSEIENRLSFLLEELTVEFCASAREIVGRAGQDNEWKQLRPVWVECQDGCIDWKGEWADEALNYSQLRETSRKRFVPIILFSCSEEIPKAQHESIHSWSYIKGAGDDEENWAHSLTPEQFWFHKDHILESEDPHDVLRTVQSLVSREKTGGNSQTSSEETAAVDGADIPLSCSLSKVSFFIGPLI